MVTGLYPENHGIISNSFYDPVTKDTFDYRDLENIKNPKWWGGEPVCCQHSSIALYLLNSLSTIRFGILS
jgi:hypothetical protein